MLVAAARADKSLFFCCESDFKIVSPASSVSVAILCACSNVSDKWSALDTEAIKTSRRSSSFKTANALLLLLLLFFSLLLCLIRRLLRKERATVGVV